MGEVLRRAYDRLSRGRLVFHGRTRVPIGMRVIQVSRVTTTSAVTYGQLVGVSRQTIYHRGKGKIRPRAVQLESLAACETSGHTKFRSVFRELALRP